MARKLSGRFEARPIAAMNLTPMVGVLLALFSVLAVTASSLGKSVNLYVEPGNVPPPYELWRALPKPVYLSVEKDGVHVGDGPVLAIDLAVARAGRLARDQKSEVVAIRADADVPYVRVAEAVRLLKDAGLTTQFVNEDIH